MLQTLTHALVISAALLLVSTVLLFTVRGQQSQGPRLSIVTAVSGAVVTALAALGVARLLGTGPAPATVIAVGLGASVLLWLPAGRAWDVRGLVA